MGLCGLLRSRGVECVRQGSYVAGVGAAAASQNAQATAAGSLQHASGEVAGVFRFEVRQSFEFIGAEAGGVRL